MWRGLYTAATGMISEMKRTDSIANNLANAANAGYKRDVTIHKEFHNMLIKRVNDFNEGGILGVSGAPLNSLATLGTSKKDVTQIRGFSANPFYNPGIGELGLGDYIDEIAVDYQQGALESTGNSLDLAIVGDGFFAFDTPETERSLKIIKATFKTYAATICLIRRAIRFAFQKTFPIHELSLRAKVLFQFLATKPASILKLIVGARSAIWIINKPLRKFNSWSSDTASPLKSRAIIFTTLLPITRAMNLLRKPLEITFKRGL